MLELNTLSREDLIRTIAWMHDTIQEWNNGWGLDKETAIRLIDIGRLCTAQCVKTNNWELPTIKIDDTK